VALDPCAARAYFLASMTPLRAALLAAALGSLLSTAPAIAAPEHRDPRLPAQIAQVVGLIDGSGIVIGADATRLVRVTAAGAVELVDHPPVGRIFHAATRGPELWVVGDRGLLHRGDGAAWRTVPLDVGALDADHRPVVAPIGAGDALVLATVVASPRGAGTAVVRFQAGRPPEPAGWFDGVTLDSAVGDGSGTAWALFTGIGHGSEPDPVLGYVRFRAGQWTLWRAGEPLVMPGIETRSTPTALFDAIVADGRGGAYAVQHALGSHHLFHLDVDGAPRPLTVLPAADPRTAEYASRTFALDERGDLLALESAAPDAAPARVVRVDPDAPDAPRGDDAVVPLPAWYADAAPEHRPFLAPMSLSTAAGVVWISAGPLLFARSGDQWTAFASNAVTTQVAKLERRAAEQRATSAEAVVGAGVLSFAAGTAAGAFASAAVHENFVPATVGATLGSVLGLTPWLFATQQDRPSAPWYAVSVGATPLLTGFGTWGLAEDLDRSKEPAAGLLGAWAGATVGTALGLAVNRIAPDASLPVRTAIKLFGLAIVGTGASLGYQLASGGPADD
jgi:hypothetical protein